MLYNRKQLNKYFQKWNAFQKQEAKMSTICVANNKGGSTKTTPATNIAVCMAQAGKKV